MSARSVKQNCWDFMNCGEAKRSCPAASEYGLDGIHGGKRAGRACWVVEGTLSKGEKKEGTFSQKYYTCSQCEFYLSVRREESGKFVPAVVLLETLE